MSSGDGEGGEWANGNESYGVWGFGVEDAKDLEVGRGGRGGEKVVGGGRRVRVGGRGSGGGQKGSRWWGVEEVFPGFRWGGVMRMLAWRLVRWVRIRRE